MNCGPKRCISRLLVVVLTGAVIAGNQQPVTAVLLTAEKPKALNLDLTLKDLTGKDVRLTQFKGKVIVLNLWATWCGPCRKEIPDLIKLQAAYPKDVIVIGVVVLDRFGDKVRAFVRDFGITYPVLDGNDRNDFEDAFGPFWGLPTSFVIDRQGRLVKKHQGQVTRQQLEREIRPLIAE